MQGRHHAVQECLLSLCRAAGVLARKEVLIDDSNCRPADVYLPHWQRGVFYAVDVTVSHPSQAPPSNGDGGLPVASASVRAATAKEGLKLNKYKAQCEAQGVGFKAAVVCCFGGWLPHGEGVVNELAERCAVRTSRHNSVIKSQFWQRLSLSLWKGNASQLLHYTT